MEAQVYRRGSAPARSSSHESLSGLDSRRFTQWPNFTFEEDHKSQDDRQSIISSAAASTTGLFFPVRTPIQQNSGFLNRIKRMCTRFPIRDVSWIVASSFTIGSAVFIVNGFFLVLPLVAPTTNFVGETPYATSASSISGTLIFLIGGIVGWLEGLNLKRGGESTLIEGVTIEVVDNLDNRGKLKDEENPREARSQSDKETDTVTSQFAPQHLMVPTVTTTAFANKTIADPTATTQPALIGSSAFIWYPTMQQFRTIYRHDLCFASAVILVVGAVVFSIATITAVPGVIDTDNTIIVDTANLLPAALGGFLFLVSSIVQMLIVQEKWYIPKPLQIEWHVGFWNAIGSFGFTLAGALPLIGTSSATFQATLADFWGSWAFFIGSFVQWYIVMGNYP